MQVSILRKFSVFLLVFSFVATSYIGLPHPVVAQTTATGTAKKEDSKAKFDDDKKDDPKVQANKPLSTKEDPNQIGKRKINAGSDKFFGWLGGSQEKEIAIGRRLAMEVEQQAKLVEDPIVTEYVNRVGQNVVLHSDAKVPFTIKVIDSDEVNAFALPGGFFFVNKGLLLAADNEAELAGVMAHEIAHVAARHAMENQGKGTLINYGALAGIIFGRPDRQHGSAERRRHSRGFGGFEVYPWRRNGSGQPGRSVSLRIGLRSDRDVDDV